jgi:hypothetical protein
VRVTHLVSGTTVYNPIVANQTVYQTHSYKTRMADEADVNQALTVCQANQQERNIFIVRERLSSLNDYAELTKRDVTELAAKLERRTVADGRVILSAKVLKNIQALCFWAREKVGKFEDVGDRLCIV